jgi:hypothetical protein
MLLNENDSKALVSLLEKNGFPCATEFVEKTVKKIMEEDDLPLLKVLWMLVKANDELRKTLKKSGLLDKLIPATPKSK